jgi:hypothetical protein
MIIAPEENAPPQTRKTQSLELFPPVRLEISFYFVWTVLKTRPPPLAARDYGEVLDLRFQALKIEDLAVGLAKTDNVANF